MGVGAGRSAVEEVGDVVGVGHNNEDPHAVAALAADGDVDGEDPGEEAGPADAARSGGSLPACSSAGPTRSVAKYGTTRQWPEGDTAGLQGAPGQRAGAGASAGPATGVGLVAMARAREPG